MRRTKSVALMDNRPLWQKEQGARCGCRGQDDYCACQNSEEPWKYGLPGDRPPTELEQTIARAERAEAQLSAAQAALKVAREVVSAADFAEADSITLLPNHPAISRLRSTLAHLDAMTKGASDGG